MYKTLYITPLYGTDESGYEKCSVMEVLGKNAGMKYEGEYRYHTSLFQKHFHGTLTMFCEDNRHITDPREILEHFNVHFTYVTALNCETGEISASDGVTYSLTDNYFCKHNGLTLINILNDLYTCTSCYIQLVIDNKTGKLIDITFIKNPVNISGTKYAYEHRIF